MVNEKLGNDDQNKNLFSELYQTDNYHKMDHTVKKEDLIKINVKIYHGQVNWTSRRWTNVLDNQKLAKLPQTDVLVKLPETDVLDKQSSADCDEPDPGQAVNLDNSPATADRQTHYGHEAESKKG